MAAEATTLSGDITTDLPHTTSGGLGRRSMRLGSGDAKVIFKSMSGDLAILRGRAASGPAGSGPAEPVAARDAAAATAAEATRLGILEALESGSIDVAEAARRLADLDHA